LPKEFWTEMRFLSGQRSQWRFSWGPK
jgi:hypothetical protein